MCRHIWEYLKSFGVGGYITLVITVYGGINIFSDVTGSPIPPLTVIPTWVWLIVLIVGLLITPFFAFNRIASTMDRFQNTQANVIPSDSFGCRESPLFQEGKPIFHIVQAWFKNAPVTRQDSSIAKQVTATIEFWQYQTTHPMLTIAGQWIESRAPDFIGFTGITNKIDIYPNDENYKLNILLKWEEDEDAYAYAVESFIHSERQDGRENMRRIQPGMYKVYVKLKGVGVDKTFLYGLKNPGKGEDLEMYIGPRD